ncbi:hypothetical protein [Herbiconiux sp. YIM B11900]|uniref:hypothetical protein n=1 Tax=Herbiconiux sp. YIM B11900 TaxID=3404131 RepID=UPI003F86D7BD
MQKMRILAAVAALLMVGAATLQPVMAQAHQSDVAASSDQATIDLLTKFGVPPHQQMALLEVAASGAPWDVYREGAVPSLVERASIDGVEYQIRRFPDGSFSAVGVETPIESRGTAPSSAESDPAITQCTYTTGSGHQSVTGCQIDGVWGTIVVGAIGVGYTLVDGGLDRMTDYGYGYQQCLIPTSCSSPSLVMSQDIEGSTAAHGRWQADVSAPWGSWNVWIQLNVGDDSAWQSNS